ncbi:MAG: 23S rRNA (uracil(1939)-C(5))-methyltransferase RlmD [Rhodospirillales bacterium]|nr:23S rRNA (uracil(1939)-C(5))-methyltransferase RlmD [Rhodospirillales bacterium]
MSLGPGTEILVDISGLGARGDGIGSVDGAAIYVPFTAPGDRVRVRLGTKRGDGCAGEVLAWERRSAARREPPCPVFGRCGGCAWQHLSPALYARTKRDLLIEALARQGLVATTAFPVDATRISPPGDRRRVRFAGERSARGVVLGLHVRGGHALVDLSDCAVAAQGIVALLAPARAVAGALDALQPGRRPAAFQLAVTLTDSGPDLTWTLPAAPGLADRERLAGFAEANRIARVSWRRAANGDDAGPAEMLLQRAPAQLRIGSAQVELPPDAFLQAGIEGERALVELVLDAVDAASRGPVADLFAGCGTFSLPLAARRAVHAADGDAASIAALDQAARHGGLTRLTAERRDLMRRPLHVEELKKFAAVVFDPPRAGALAQAQELARSKVPAVVAVSCDPATLARDLKILVDGGYAIERVVPIDQFLWSPRIEAVAMLRRPTRR